MIVSLSQPTTISIVFASLLAVIAVLALLRIILRKEPSPPSWRRYRLGVFVERDADHKDKEEE